MSNRNILIYLLRKDLRVSDNPILHHLTSSEHAFTHLLPIFVFPAHQIEISGFIKDGKKSPYPEARSDVGGYWRCGPHRAKFIGQSVWNLKESLESINSGLVLRVGTIGDVVKNVVEQLHEKDYKVGAVWMTGEEGVEEQRDERAVSSVCEKFGANFKLWTDEKYFIDDRDLNFNKPEDLSDIFTTYRKSTEPLREKPRPTLPRPEKSALPPLPDHSEIPPQTAPFVIPDTCEALEDGLLEPLKNYLPEIPPLPDSAASAHPFRGGEDSARARLDDWLGTCEVEQYKVTRNHLLGAKFSTKLSAFLAQGCVTARQVHEALVEYEDGTNDKYAAAAGYGKGENEGTGSVRFELLWRDYMRLCHRKYKQKLFRLEGFQEDQTYNNEEEKKRKWKTANDKAAPSEQDPSPREIGRILDRYKAGTTGMGLIDASQRELIHSGYTSNRARQNVAGFLSKHLGIDWRYGAEWYEMLLVDYDVSSNWANWQYVAGVGNDPRGQARIFNPVKQSFDYDKDGTYVSTWVPELAKFEKLENRFQAWTASPEDLEKAGLAGNPMVTDPLKKINFSVEGKPKSSKRPYMGRYARGGSRPRTAPGNNTTEPQQQQSSAMPNGQPPAGPSHYQQNGNGYYQNGDNHRGGFRGDYRGPRGGGGYRGRGFHTGRSGGAGYRGRYHGPPRGWAPQPTGI